ncbi:transcriptional repressor [Coemansia sp. RSA 2702]|nr:transcriptional repressor [Coemansia sp. RSA 2702]
MSCSPTSTISSSSSPSPASPTNRLRRPSHLGLWSTANSAAFTTPEKQPRSLSIRTAEGQCVSILNDDSPISSGASDAGSDDSRHYPHSDCGLRLSIPMPSPGNSLHCIRRTHSSGGIALPSPQPTRLPSLSALVEAAALVSDSRDMPMLLPPPCTPSYSPSHSHSLHLHPASAPAYSRVALRTQNKRKYPCTFPGCGKAFTTSGHLSRHFRIHTGEKNYHCLYPGCASRFSRQDNMMQHYRTHLSPRSRRNRTMRSASEYAGYAAGSAFSPYKRPATQHSPSALAQWSFF